MLTAQQLRGCYPALITPMRNDEGRVVVDVDAFHRLIASVIDAGVSGIVIAGTTGQSATLQHDEQVKLVNDGALYARGYAAGQSREIHIIASPVPTAPPRPSISAAPFLPKAGSMLFSTSVAITTIRPRKVC